MTRYATLLFLMLFLFPLAVEAQELERSVPSDRRYTVTAGFQQVRGEPREMHITPLLIGSDEGQRILEQYRELYRAGAYEGKIRLMEAQTGDTRSFKVRNIEESQSGDTVFDEVTFELARASDDLEVGGRVEVWVQEGERGPDKVSDEILDQILAGLADQTPSQSVNPGRGIVEIGRELFGEQPDVTGTGSLKILIADIEDGWDGEEQNVFTAGFFDPVNLLPASKNENSNEADILYINSVPGIYRPDTGPLANRLNTMAHEFQHLIHANYDALSLFQNEGQSELAEILTGYSARSMSFLNLPGEVRGSIGESQGWIYRFRTDSGENVLYDYQRAQLLHSYLEELVGYVEAGSLTRSENTRDAAYLEVLQRNGVTLTDFYTGFWISAYGNRRVSGESYGFSRPQLANVKVSNPGRFYYALEQPWVRGRQETLYYGGAFYTEWFGIEELHLTVEETEGIDHQLLYRLEGETTYQLMDVGTNPIQLESRERLYEQVVLVSVNNKPTGREATPSESRTFRYSGDWTPTDLITEDLVYHGEASFLTRLPEGDLQAYAVRISPDFDAGVRTVRFSIYQQEGSVQGEGDLRVTLRESRPSTEPPDQLIPGNVIVSQPVSMSDLSIGENYIGVNSEQWQVEAGEEYFITLEVVEDRGGLMLELLMDEGVAEGDGVHPRSLGGYKEGNTFVSWGPRSGTLDNDPPEPREHLNLLMSASLVGFQEADRPDFPEPPVNDSVELFQNYPNPFTQTTSIEFSLPEDAEIEISLHDILGRKVDILHSGYTPAGLHTLEYDPGELASGIYFYRLVYPGGVTSRRMTRLR